MTRQFRRLMLGRKSAYFGDAKIGNWVGIGFLHETDLSPFLGSGKESFKRDVLPVFMAAHPDKNKRTAGLACGALYTVCDEMAEGDIVLCPDGKNSYHLAEVIGSYRYAPEHHLKHQRPVRWLGVQILRSDMSPALQNSTGSIGTVSNVSHHSEELERFLTEQDSPQLTVSDTNVEDPSVFALEKHLEDFLVANWANTSLGKTYNIFESEEGYGQQYPSDTGPIDILAVAKDGSEFLVIELKKGRASDSVVGQVQRYMGYVKHELAEQEQGVKGLVIAFEDDKRLRRALSVAPDISFLRYRVSFDLFDADLD